MAAHRYTVCARSWEATLSSHTVVGGLGVGRTPGLELARAGRREEGAWWCANPAAARRQRLQPQAFDLVIWSSAAPPQRSSPLKNTRRAQPGGFEYVYAVVMGRVVFA